MTKEQKELIKCLLSNALEEQKESLKRVRSHDDNPLYEDFANRRMKLIEETYKEMVKYDRMETL